jgi:hypothetical protein
MPFSVSKVPRTVADLVQPAVQAVAARLFLLTHHREGSQKHKPTVASFYETGIVTSLYEQLLMTPGFRHMDIRHEMPYEGTYKNKRRVDLWLRPVKGGTPHLIEVGDFAVGKVHQDGLKIDKLNRTGRNWFLAFFRKDMETVSTKAVRERIETSFNRADGLRQDLVDWDRRLTRAFDIWRPDGVREQFGYSLLRILQQPQDQ